MDLEKNLLSMQLKHADRDNFRGVLSLLGVIIMGQFADTLGKHLPPTRMSRKISLSQPIESVTRRANAHDKTYSIPGSEDSVTVVADSEFVRFGVSSAAIVTGVNLLANGTRPYNLMRCSHPENFPISNDDRRSWWKISRGRVVNNSTLQVVYSQGS